MSDAGSEAQGGGDEPFLRVEGLARDFGPVSVLEDVSFGVEAGEVACIVGPNGAGKTTLLRIVAGLLRPTAGSVTVDADADRPVGYLQQQPAFRPRFTLAETLTYYATLAGVDPALDERLSTVGLQDVPGRRVEALSGGMTRLLGIAQATIGDPPLLVLDEPSSGLDPVIVEHVSAVIGDLAASGAAVLLATHNVAAVEQMADRVLVLDRGRVVAADPPADIVRETGEDSLVGALASLIGREGADIPVSVGRREDEP